MTAVMADKFEQFEWLTHGITAKSPNFEPQAHGTGEKPLNYGWCFKKYADFK